MIGAVEVGQTCRLASRFRIGASISLQKKVGLRLGEHRQTCQKDIWRGWLGHQKRGREGTTHTCRLPLRYAETRVQTEDTHYR